MTDLGTDERRLAIEAIATLCHIKRTMAELLLRPSGIPDAVFGPLLYRRDDAGRFLSKRQIAPLIIAACEADPQQHHCIRRLLEVTAAWNSFHLADDEYG